MSDMQYQQTKPYQRFHDAVLQAHADTMAAEMVRIRCDVMVQQDLWYKEQQQLQHINDQYGHAAGDAVLQQVSARLLAIIRDSDTLSRHGGDEFLLLLSDISHSTDVTRLAAKMEQALAQPYQVDGNSLTLSASIGIALFPQHGDTAKALISYADAAMYRAKQQGGAEVCG